VTGTAGLAQLVGAQRWFGSKSRALAGGSVIAYGDLEPGFALALYEMRFAEGDAELYQLPMRLVGSSEIEISLADPELGRALLAAMLRGQPMPLTEGTADFALTGPLALGPDELAPVRAVGGEQSNSSIVFGERLILKAYRRLEAGESPELELLRALTAQGFEHTPRLLGSYRYAGPRIEATLGILQEFAAGARDGWLLALASLGDSAHFVPLLRRLGEVTARMHTALAAADDPAFRPEPVGAGAAERAEAEARALLEGLAPGGPAEPVRTRRDEVLARLRARPGCGEAGRAIRQHGDYHLGQVLWTGDDWLVLDFEGEPARPLAERRLKSTPLRDVAGMLRSFAYAAETGRARGDADDPGWEPAARAAFLSGYGAEIDETLLPAPGGPRERLLAACELEKALYELRYELDNRPDWVGVPVAGILRLLDGEQ
jgi:maltokinase